MEKYKLTYKGRDYIYGFENLRDYPKRGKTSNPFFIKLVYNKPFKRTKVVLRSNDIKFLLLTTKELIEFVEKEIDKYIIISRRRKLKIITNRKDTK